MLPLTNTILRGCPHCDSPRKRAVVKQTGHPKPHQQYLLPTVQNCPNLFWDATRSPLSSVVTLVSNFSCPSTAAKTGFGTPGKGDESGMSGQAPPLLNGLCAGAPGLKGGRLAVTQDPGTGPVVAAQAPSGAFRLPCRQHLPFWRTFSTLERQRGA